MREDFVNWSAPEILMAKRNIPVANKGKMIDPYILDDNGIFRCFLTEQHIFQ